VLPRLQFRMLQRRLLRRFGVLHLLRRHLPMSEPASESSRLLP
jgi:hypothetical protein